MALNDLLQRWNADQPTLQNIQQAMPGTVLHEAVSVALRVCAGCLDAAKALRKTELVS